MKKVLVFVVIIFLVSLGFMFFSKKLALPKSQLSNNITLPETVDTSVTPITNVQASFAIFTNGTFRIFTAAMYHNLSQDVYIEADNPNIVQVKKTDTSWNDFFLTLPFSLTSECLTTGTKETFCTGSEGALQFYINGKKTTDALSRKINDGDKLLVTFGKESDVQIKRQIDKIP